MVNTRVKGRKAELELKEMLEEAGWTVHLVRGSTRFNREVDLFNLWDILALKGERRKWIQVKCNRKPSFKPYSAFALRYGNEFDSFEVWVRTDYKGWRDYLL